MNQDFFFLLNLISMNALCYWICNYLFFLLQYIKSKQPFFVILVIIEIFIFETIFYMSYNEQGFFFFFLTKSHFNECTLLVFFFKGINFLLHNLNLYHTYITLL